MRTYLQFFIQLTLLSMIFSETISASDSGTIVFDNGKIITVNSTFEVNSSMAIRDGRIIPLGAKAAELK
ncbi:MAG: hypothetical protein ACKO5E_13490, partial [bacterium]